MTHVALSLLALALAPAPHFEVTSSKAPASNPAAPTLATVAETPAPVRQHQPGPTVPSDDALPPKARSRTESAAFGAGIGMVFGITAGTLGVVIDAADVRYDVALPMGVASLALHACAVPIASGGSRAARRHPWVRGNPGLRAASWAGYGITFGLAGLAIVTNADGTGIAYGLAAATSAIGMSAEAIIAREQGIRANEASTSSTWNLSVTPYGSRRELGVALSGRF